MITSAILPSTRVGRGAVLSTEISGRLVLMNARQGNYVSLDEIGSAIWQQLTQARTVAELCEDLQTQYDVDRAALDRDVIAFLENLHIQGLLAIVPDSAAATAP